MKKIIFSMVLLVTMGVFALFFTYANGEGEGGVRPLVIAHSDGVGRTLEGILDKYQSDTGVAIEKLNVPYDNGNATRKYLTMYKAGAAPAIVHTTTGGITSLTPILLPIVDSELVAFAKKVWPGYKGFMYNKKGELIAFQQHMSIQGVWLNKDLFEKAGVAIQESKEDIWTWDEFINAVEQVQKATGVQYGLTYDTTTGRYVTFLYEWGGRLFEDDGTIYINDKNGVKALTKFVEYHNRGVISKAFWVGGEDPRLAFLSGQAVALFSGNWMAEKLEKAPFNAIHVYNPIGTMRSTTPGGNLLMALQGSGQEKEAVEFLKYYFLKGLNTEYLKRTYRIDAYGEAVDYGDEKINKIMSGFQDELPPTPLYTTEEWANSAIMPTVAQKLKEAVILAINGDGTPQEVLDVVAKVAGQEFEDEGITPKYIVMPK